MNMLQRNPRDPKHREFHDGEYEYWPAKTPRSGRSTGFPAACLIAAMAASALLAAALTMLYSLTSPKAIYEDFAIVNVNIYNNVDNLDIRYTLSPKSDPDTVIQEGALEHSEHTLNLQGLTPGTQYILQYTSLKDGEWKPIGDFQFKTPGNPPEQSEQPLPTPAEPTSESEPTKQPEAAKDATEPTTETKEDTESDEPLDIWYPTPDPAPNPTPDPEPGPTPNPPADPEETPIDPEEPPEPDPSEPDPSKPAALDPVIDRVTYSPPDSGTDVYYSVHQTHSFQNIPDPEGATIEIVLKDENNEEKTIYLYDGDDEENYIPPDPDYISIPDFSIYVDTDGSLVVTFTETMVADKPSSTTVTVTWEGGTPVSSTIAVPFVDETNATLAINGDGFLELKITSEYELIFDVEFLLTDSNDEQYYTGIEYDEDRMTGPVGNVYTYNTGVSTNNMEEIENSVVDSSAAEKPFIWSANVSAIWADAAGSSGMYPLLFTVSYSNNP